jgi:protein TonB
MRWAIAISITLHLLALTLFFRTPGFKDKKYPSVLQVGLYSPPPAKGVENPQAVQKTVEPTKAKPKPQKIEAPIKDARLADINKNKKPIPQKQKETQVKEETKAPDTQESKSKGLPSGVELGSEFGSAKLDAVGFDSPYYLNILFNKIRNQWDNPFEGTDKIQCTIYFVIGRDGHIIDSAIETSSGVAVYDQAALRAVLASRPAPLPGQYDSDELGIHLEFDYIPNQ